MPSLIVALMMIFAGPYAHAQGADVGLVDMVQGPARFVPLTGSGGEVKAFMKIRDGDRVNLPAGTQVRLVYFESGRRERWLGPASFRAGKSASEEISGKPAEVALLPVGANQRIARIPELLQNARLGGIQVRGGLAPRRQAGLDQPSALKEARETYDSMRKGAAADDITPELVLYAALDDFLLFDEMKIVVDEMLRKQPDNDEIRRLRAWLERRGAK